MQLSKQEAELILKVLQDNLADNDNALTHNLIAKLREVED